VRAAGSARALYWPVLRPPGIMTPVSSPGSSPSAGSPRLLRRGKVKEVWEVSPTELEFVFSDDISVFDKRIPSPIPHKGESLARTAAHWFELCAREGVNHHFLRLSAPNRMRVRRVEVVEHPKPSPHPRRQFIPLEFVVRYYVAGSLWDRVQAGKAPAPELGFPAGHQVTYGEKLPQPLFEVTTKLEKVDRLLTFQEAAEVGGLLPGTLEEVRSIILRIDEALQREIAPRGLLHVDGKKEFGFDEEGHLMVVDTFGTADEDRFWDAKAYAAGEFKDFSKEFVRQHYRRSGYHTALVNAREQHREEPPIPPLPPELVTQVSHLYTGIFERLTGEPFAGAPAR
jgi:phosphoribosylaminoimidazole-succinocarboxamide synthase